MSDDTLPGSDADDWCTVAEAARRLRVTPTAVRNRIRRGTLETRPNGNHGHLVRVPVPEPVSLTVQEPRIDTVSTPLPSPVETELRVQIAELQARLTTAQEGLIAMAREAGASKAEIAGLTAQLADAKADRDRWHQVATRVVEPVPHRSWWRRLVG